MKIIFINRVMAMFQGGGETYSLNIAKGLRTLGCEVIFVVSRPWFGKVKYPLKDFTVEYVPSPYLRDFAQWMWRWESLFELIPGKYFKAFLTKVYKYIFFIIFTFDDLKSQNDIFSYLKKRKNDYDIVQVFGHVALASRIAKDLNKPVVIRFPGPPGKKKKKQIIKCDAIIANGDAFKYIKDSISMNVVDIPPGIDVERFKHVNTDIRSIYGISNDDKLVIFVGRFVFLKNIPFLISGMAEVIKQDDKVKLMLVGDGPLYGLAKKLVSKFSIENNVIFTGKIPHDNLPKYYSAADLFLITSNYDNFPNAVIEAMSCGLPIVGTKVGGIPHMVEEGLNGFCIENNNIEELKEAVLKLLGNKQLRHDIGERNRENVKVKYDWGKSAERFLEIYKEVMVKG